MSSPNLYIAVCDFLSLLQNPDGKPDRVERGSLLTLTAAPPSNLSRSDNLHPPILWLRVYETEKVVGVDPESVKEIGLMAWRTLLAVTDTEERCAFYMDQKRLRDVMCLKQGDYVRVQVKSSSGRKERGVLCYKGSVNHEQEIFFGVQLMVSYKQVIITFVSDPPSQIGKIALFFPVVTMDTSVESQGLYCKSVGSAINWWCLLCDGSTRMS